MLGKSNRGRQRLVGRQARQIARGQAPLVDLENDKSTVIALREIAEGLVDESILDEVPTPAIDEDEMAANLLAGT